ncbi:hypothetical protein NEIPOLOT_00648 [Neisseria polysaccharea ATCC 43768]|nr:hypothetical protein NEIPOLOT_00648 [Neisseria polysaccharea ATCC 43768]
MRLTQLAERFLTNAVCSFQSLNIFFSFLLRLTLIRACVSVFDVRIIAIIQLCFSFNHLILWFKKIYGHSRQTG